MKLYLKRGAIVGFVIALGIIGALGIYSYLAIQQLINSASLLSHSTRVINAAERVLVTLIDLETGQRGFIITGDEKYLAPYNEALKGMDVNFRQLENVTIDDPFQRDRVAKLGSIMNRKIEIVIAGVEARRESFEAAQAKVRTGLGKVAMDEMRMMIKEIQEAERKSFSEGNVGTSQTLTLFQYSFVGLLLSSAVIILILFYNLNIYLAKKERAEMKLVTAAEEISKLNHDLEGFSYSVSHDLRAPLRSVNGYAEILKEDYAPNLDEEGRRVVEVIINNARRMGRLIDDLLDFSRLGRKELSKARMEIQQMVNDIVEEFNEQSVLRPVTVNVGTLPSVHADEGMIRQVWVNLISNAFKYSGKNPSPVVEIGSFADGQEICYFVKDNGVGFNMEYVNKLFGVFQRLHKQDEFEGTGVGLALVKRIITRHGGRIWAEAELNKGATFYFSIPK